jgi:acyl-CoA thioesterase-2
MSQDLREILELERLEDNLFRGFSPDTNRHRIFGGQVIAQSLLAAYATVENRLCHSLHAYFIRPGDPKIPIIYEVDRSRDGKSFTTRRIVAIQHGRQILNMAASFQVEETGFEHQFDMPEAPSWEGHAEMVELEADLIERRTGVRPQLIDQPPFEMRFVEPNSKTFMSPNLPPRQLAWFRLRQPMDDDARWQQVALAYASDMALISASLHPHAMMWNVPNMQSASLDHALWFHRPSNVSDWHLYDIDSPSASGARGFNRGSIYSPDGTLIASAAQEGLIRFHPDK